MAPSSSRRGSSRHVKQEPPVQMPLRRQSISTNQTDPSLGSEAPTAERSFYIQRSNAPPPSSDQSEHVDATPLLREIRNLPTVAVESQHRPAVDDSFLNLQNSFSDIGKKLKAYNDTLGELQQLGVSRNIELPELVLVGDQSAGKSSLMSGLANLDLPRSEGTCTRCPLHIRVSRSTEWSCRVSLRKDYVYMPPDNGIIREEDVTAAEPFFPWRKLPSALNQEFKTMSDKNDIEDVLRWAQVAILNDHQNFELFIPGSGGIAKNTEIEYAAQRTAAKFSPNVVSLEIKGPGLPDLSFYDMPGIFQNPDDAQDDYLVHVVRNLSQEYINHPSAIIMCSMPMNNDPENSSTFNLTRLGQHEQWLRIMKGEKHRTGLGYFITSRPKDQDLEQLKKWEEHVFEDHGLGTWPQEFREFSDKCGVEKLKAFLSERLGQAFSQSLPLIKEQVHRLLQATNNNLAKLPELPSNAELEVQTALLKFADGARTKIDGIVEHFNTLPNNFKNCLLHIKPKFNLRDKSDIPVVEISDDESETGITTAGKRRNGAPQTPSKRARIGSVAPQANGFDAIKEEDALMTAPASPTPSAGGTPRPMLPHPFSEFSHIGRGFRTLKQVRDEIEQKASTGMPDRIADAVFKDLALLAVKPWDGPAKAFLSETIRLLHEGLYQALGSALENLKKRYIFKESLRHIKAFLEENRLKTQVALDALYHNETTQFFTINAEAFTQYKAEETMALVRFRHQMRMQAAGLAKPTNQMPAWETMTEDKRALETKRRNDELSKLGPDRFDKEVDVIGYVRGYYRLAAYRYADSVAQCILCRMIPEIRMRLPLDLETKLGLRSNNGPAIYESLLAEDQATARKRESLKAEKKKFEAALRSIAELEAGMGGDSGVSDAEMEEVVDGEV
ncbi:P-loop containing nucleoside triphosphate hydrolase protein [Stachybotrys elegans]|uniref:P-loop containing nucleoside triphosphate hydrolase protein n=1 Tax=Stachybotrys elegans TaxID=80388 RepID=A0A8K0WT42_9HYPO|nr:P-loop containing nucleoside triphosphate hydrolase protein [Stachybotrys elegans]